mmetsp:Transcript_15041/g.31396  ORF Transcript_15041/g.31396 Transcript_15041/m.31396 type:complete len:201 (+) Transcript_15041:866-1468(+)
MQDPVACAGHCQISASRHKPERAHSLRQHRAQRGGRIGGTAGARGERPCSPRPQHPQLLRGLLPAGLGGFAAPRCQCPGGPRPVAVEDGRGRRQVGGCDIQLRAQHRALRRHALPGQTRLLRRTPLSLLRGGRRGRCGSLRPDRRRVHEARKPRLRRHRAQRADPSLAQLQPSQRRYFLGRGGRVGCEFNEQLSQWGPRQ